MSSSNPYVKSDAVRDWAQHVEQRRQEAQAPTYDIVDKVANVPGDMINWGKMKLRQLGEPGQNVGDGTVAYPGNTAQQVYQDYQANPQDQKLRQEWLEAVNAGRVNLQRGR